MMVNKQPRGIYFHMNNADEIARDISRRSIEFISRKNHQFGWLNYWAIVGGGPIVRTNARFDPRGAHQPPCCAYGLESGAETRDAVKARDEKHVIGEQHTSGKKLIMKRAVPLVESMLCAHIH